MSAKRNSLFVGETDSYLHTLSTYAAKFNLLAKIYFYGNSIKQAIS